MSDTRATVTGRFVGGGLFEPRLDPQNKDKAPKFSACVVLDEGQAAIIEGIRDVALEEKFGNKVPKGLQDWTVREGDDEDFEATFGKMFINPKMSNNKNKEPKRVHRDESGAHVSVKQSDDIIYPGCKVAISVNAYAYSGDQGAGIKPGVTLGLRAVMYTGKGERLDDNVNVDNEFDGVEAAPIEVEDDDDFLATG